MPFFCSFFGCYKSLHYICIKQNRDMNTAFLITTAKTDRADFYIQLKGENAGQPMKEPTANSAAVITNKAVLDAQYFYYVVLCVYTTGAFKQALTGSVIPFIKIKDVEKIIIDFLKRGK